jgi:hypothetical protein
LDTLSDADISIVDKELAMFVSVRICNSLLAVALEES